jgi:hypothetical protein
LEDFEDLDYNLTLSIPDKYIPGILQESGANRPSCASGENWMDGEGRMVNPAVNHLNHLTFPWFLLL